MQSTIFLLVAFLFTANSFAENSPFWGDLKSGSHKAGFQVIEKYDYGRPFKRKVDYEGNPIAGERARPIQISVWYPAKSNSQNPMRLSDYVHLIGSEDLSKPTPASFQQAEQLFFHIRWFQGAPEEKLKELLANPTNSYKDAQHATGRFPLILLANSVSLSSPFSHFVLAEYLASHGYIVASIPTRGLQSRDLDGREANVQMQDMQFVMDALHDFASLDRDRLGLIGFGVGGLSTALLAMHNSDVDALVSLNTSLADRFGYSMIFKNTLYKPNQLTIPILHITNQETTPDTDLAFFKSARFSTVQYLKLKGLGPADFSSIGMLKSMLPPPKEGEAPNTKLGYETLCRYVLHFLNSNVQKDSAGKQFLRNNPEANGIPAGFALTEFKEGIKIPPTEQQFVEIVRTKGARKAGEIQKEFASLIPDYRIYDPDVLFPVADEHAQNKKTDEAIAVLNLCVEAFPDYWECYDKIGRIHMDNGNKKLAIENLSKSIELNPENPETVEALKKLKES
jgi:Tetratricopeptide repeat